MQSYNFRIEGNLTKTPELKYTQQGKPVMSLDVAVDTGYYDYQAKEWKDRTEYFNNIAVWENKAEGLTKRNPQKGDFVIIELNIPKAEHYTNNNEELVDVVRWTANAVKLVRRGNRDENTGETESAPAPAAEGVLDF